MSKLIRSLLLFLSLIFLSCEECLNIEEIDVQTEILNSWLTDDSISQKSLTSSIGISDQVELSHDFQDFGDSIWDDCGQVSQSFRSSVDYQFFNFPFQLTTEFYKQGEENGFEFVLEYNQRRFVYNFTNQTSSPSQSIVEVQSLQLEENFYPEALQVTISNSSNPSDIKTLYLVKDMGIVQMVLQNGVVLNLN
jgi:hypothetical protein